MEKDPSYQVIEFPNIYGQLFLLHSTRNNDFCHLKITLRSTYWAWLCKSFRLYSARIFLLLLLFIGSLFRLFNDKIGKFHIISIVFVFLIFLFMHYKYVVEENIICIKNFGVQMSTVYFTGRMLQEFIPQSHIADCVINEVIYSQRVIFVLIILISKTKDIENYSANRYEKIERAVTLFKGIKPRLKTLQLMQRELRQVIFDEEKMNGD